MTASDFGALNRRLARLRFDGIAAVYNPLVYARAPLDAYLRRWGRPRSPSCCSV